MLTMLCRPCCDVILYVKSRTLVKRIVVEFQNAFRHMIVWALQILIEFEFQVALHHVEPCGVRTILAEAPSIR